MLKAQLKLNYWRNSFQLWNRKNKKEGCLKKHPKTSIHLCSSNVINLLLFLQANKSSFCAQHSCLWLFSNCFTFCFFTMVIDGLVSWSKNCERLSAKNHFGTWMFQIPGSFIVIFISFCLKVSSLNSAHLVDSLDVFGSVVCLKLMVTWGRLMCRIWYSPSIMEDWGWHSNL